MARLPFQSETDMGDAGLEIDGFPRKVKRKVEAPLRHSRLTMPEERIDFLYDPLVIFL